MSAIEVKYLFNFSAISSESETVMHSLSKFFRHALFEALEFPVSVRKCAQICFVSLKLLIDLAKYFRFEALIIVLFYFDMSYISFPFHHEKDKLELRNTFILRSLKK